MSIFSRARDILAANVADMLDRADDPAKMIRMIILEMEETLVEVRASAARLIADQKELSRHTTRLDQLEADWHEKAAIALSRDREDLAKAALAEGQKVSDTAQQMRAEVNAIDKALRLAEDDIAKLQTKLSEARSRQNMIAMRIDQANSRYRARDLYSGDRTHQAFSRFEILEREADLAEGRADAAGLGRPSLEEEMAALRTSEKVDAALAALKARLNKKD